MKKSISPKRSGNTEIAVIGVGCFYPGAKNPLEFWENILTRRQQFREMPDVRLPIKDYYDPDPEVPDKTYQNKAALLDGYEFNWLEKRIPKKTYESTDIVHWLALDTALQALADSEIRQNDLPLETTGVVLGNSLTGEFTRSNNLLLRWPYVKKALQASLNSKGLSVYSDSIERTLEKYYKSVFAPVNEDSLAGGLSNTIAGRVCNFLDIHGGGFIVDGACSSSLLAVCTAANYLELGQMDLVIAGGVDISLDTFELIGFAKTSALTRDEMRVYDKNGKGFLPGEGCGVVILKRLEDAVRDNNQVYAILKGWGISSDGKGGITAPSASGQSRALLRAYKKAKFNPANLSFIEGHGTGTAVGDRTELEGISIALNNENKFTERTCGVTSLKSIIGHTKAAAGVGAFIKTVIALNQRVIPPTAGCKDWNPIFDDKASMLYPVKHGHKSDENETMYAGVSAMGFGGINSHVVLQSGNAPSKKFNSVIDERKLMVSNQTHELFIFSASEKNLLNDSIKDALKLAKGISYAELADFAYFNNNKTDMKAKYRAAVVAENPFDLQRKLAILINALSTGESKFQSLENNTVVFGIGKKNLRIGGLFPGQGSQKLNMTYKLFERFDWVQEVCKNAEKAFSFETSEEILASVFKSSEMAINTEQLKQWQNTLKQTNIAQPTITLASLVWKKYLEKLGINLSAVTGHSLGELMAFQAAGYLSEEEVLRFAAFRGKIMAGCGSGTMASLACAKEKAEEFIKQINGYVTIANVNAPEQTVISGEENTIAEIIKIAEKNSVSAVLLPVSAAFHSSLVAEAANSIKHYAVLKKKQINDFKIKLVSSVTGKPVNNNTDLNQYFAEQSINPVNFIDAVKTLSDECDLLIEIGPGRVLSGLSGNINKEIMSFPLDINEDNDLPLNVMLANTYVMGAVIQIKVLYENRLIREFIPVNEKKFLVNPCERPFPPIEQENSGINTDFMSALFPVKTEDSMEKMTEYLDVRADFIKEIVQADYKHFHSENNKRVLKPEKKEQFAKNVIISESIINEEVINVEETIFAIVSAKTGFPVSGLKSEFRLLNDLNLDSIKAGSLLAEISKKYRLNGSLNTARFTNASIGDICKKVAELIGPVPNAQGKTVDKQEIKEFLYTLVEQKTGFPSARLKPEFRLLNDLNLDSIKAGALIAEISKKYEVQGKLTVSAMANASLEEIYTSVLNLISPVQKTELNVIDQPRVKDYIFSLLEKKTGFPVAQINSGYKLLNDLNLDSIKAGSLLTEVAKTYNIQGKFEVSKYLNSSLQEIIDKIESLASPVSKTAEITNGIKKDSETRVQSYTVKSERIIDMQTGDTWLKLWKTKKTALIYSKNGGSVASGLVNTLVQYTDLQFLDVTELSDPKISFDTLLVIMPTVLPSNEGILETIELLSLVSAYQYEKPKEIGFIQFGNGYFSRNNPEDISNGISAASFAASLHLERPESKIRVFEFTGETNPEKICLKISDSFSTNEMFAVLGYDDLLQSHRMVYENTPGEILRPRKTQINRDDVFIVTGGAKGITAECAFAMCKEYKCKVALIGTSAFNGEEGEIKKTLEKYKNEKLIAKYYSCNISDLSEVQKLTTSIRKDFGKITGVIHGAGKNVPRRSEHVPYADAVSEISPKINGAINLYRSLDMNEIKYFIALTSIIGVTGMTGNSWYAFSNETLDLFIRHLNCKHSIETLSLAYSVWSDIGMGERMGSTHTLATMGIGAIPPDQGVKEFLKWVRHQPDDNQVVVAAGTGDLDTWYTAKTDFTRSKRYLEKILFFKEGVKLVVRNKLKRTTDLYLDDHNYKGSLLFPTVFGIEAMAEAASLVTGIHEFSAIKLENISLAKPIVVPDDSELEIEINATVEKNESGDLVVNAGISTEHTGFSENHFSARLSFNQSFDKVLTESFPVKEPLSIEPENDLYSWILFQGPKFQLIDKVYGIEKEKIQFTTIDTPVSSAGLCFSDSTNLRFALGNPLLRDTLLQSVQLLLTKNIVLPIGIKKWEIVDPANRYKGGKAICTLTGWDGDIGTCNVVVSNDKNEVTEYIEGYEIKMMESVPSFPETKDLIDIQSYTNKIFDSEFSKYEPLYEEKITTGFYKHHTSFNKIAIEERHEIEQRILQTMKVEGNPKLIWLQNGKPVLSTKEKYVSVTHCQSYLFITAGNSEQGCDIELVSKRTPEEWTGLFESRYSSLLKTIQQFDSDTDSGNTRLWCVREVCMKSGGYIPQTISILKEHERAVIFEVRNGNNIETILTFPVELLPGNIFMVAVQAKLKTASAEESVNRTNDVSISFDPLNKKFITNFYTTFKDCRGFFGKTYFTDYALWMGNLREYILAPVKKELMRDLGSGEFGMVTNDSTIRIFQEAGTLEKITGRLSITDKSDLKNSFIDLAYEWLKHLDNGKTIKIAESVLSTTWVKIEKRGIVKLSPLPGYFYDFLNDHIRSNNSAGEHAFSLSGFPGIKDLGSTQYKSAAFPRPEILLTKQSFSTGINNANTVGNLYYSNYYDWQAKIMESFLYEVMPEIYLQNGRQGEYICLESNVNHLQEAMPFENIEVSMYLEEMYTNGIKLFFEYHSIKHSEKRKLAYGHNILLWAKRKDEDSVPKTMEIPTELRDVFIKSKTNNLV